MPEQSLSNNWAVIKQAGHQHLVRVGDTVIVNRLTNKEGETIKTDSLLDAQPVELRVVKHLLGEKVNGLKFKNKVRFLRRYGHRQAQTTLEVMAIGATRPAPKIISKTVTILKTPKKATKPVAKARVAKKIVRSKLTKSNND